MKNVPRTIACATIAALAILPAAIVTGQQQDQQPSSASMEARSERREAALELLIAAQQKCYDQALANAQAGQHKKTECPILDEMIQQTPIETLVGQPMRGLEARVPSEEILKLKHAILDAAYFGYQRGKWKSAKY